MQVTGSPEFKTSSLKPVAERDSSPILRQLPSRCFVLNRTVGSQALESWETLLPWLDFFAVVVEPSDSRPSSFGRSLSGLGVKFSSEREFLSQNSAISTQLILPDAFVVHPVSDATIPNESSSTNGFINPLILLLRPLKFCLKYQHIYANITGVTITSLEKAVLEGRGFRPNFSVIIFKTSLTLLDDICFNPIKMRLLVVVLTSTNDERSR